MSRVDVLHVIANLSVGGAEVHLLSLLRGLVGEGRSVALAFYRERPDEARSLRAEFEAAGVRTYDLGLRRVPVAGWIRLARLVRRLRPRVVHTHLSRVTAFDAAVVHLAFRAPVVVSVHNNEAYFASPLWRLLLRWGTAPARRFVAISGAVHRAITGALGVDPARIEVVYYGLDPARFAAGATPVREELGVTPGEILVGTIGRMAEQKGQRYLISAMPLVRREFPNVRLAIVGHDTGAREGLRRQVEHEGLDDVVRLVGYRDDVPAVLASFDLFVLPSLWEGFGLVLIEAMAVGVPVIASAVDSVPEVVEDGVSGMLVEPRDVEGLAEAIVSLLRDTERRGALVRAGRDRVTFRFTEEAMVRRTLAVYDEMAVPGGR